MSNYAPILVSVYTRLEHFQRCIKALQNNLLASKSELFVVSDGAARSEHIEAVAAVRNYARNIKGFKKVHLIFRQENRGMFSSIICCHNELLERYGKLIFLEDDILSAPTFLSHLNQALDYYQTNKNIFSVHGYSYPIDYDPKYKKDLFLFPRYNPWGVGLWADRWQQVNFDESQLDNFFQDPQAIKNFIKPQPILLPILEKRMQAADAMISYHLFKNNLTSVYPIKNHTINIGFDDSGKHCGNDPVYAEQSLPTNLSIPECTSLTDHPIILRQLSHFFGYPNLQQRIINKVKRLLPQK